MFDPIEIIEHLDGFDFPGREVASRQPHEGFDIGPGDRIDPKTVRRPAIGEPQKDGPEVGQRDWKRRAFQFGLIFCPPLLVSGALEETAEDIAVRDAVFIELVESERLLRECPQVFAEAGIKARSAFR